MERSTSGQRNEQTNEREVACFGRRRCQVKLVQYQVAGACGARRMAGGFGGHTKIGEERGTAALGWETLGGWVRKRRRRSGRGTLGRQAPDSGGDRVQKMWAGWAGLEEGAWGRSVGEGGVGGERARCLASLVDGLSCKTWGGCAGCCVTGCRAPPGPSLVCFASTFVYSRPLKRWQLLSSGALAGPAAARKLPCRSELLARLADVADDAGGDVGVAQVDCRAGRGLSLIHISEPTRQP